jgi:galactonate dehydratase
MGYSALKLDPFGHVTGHFERQDRDFALRIVKSVREAIPSTVDLMIEGHCRFDVPSALDLALRLAEYEITWFEEPVTYLNLKGLTELAARSPVRIATGENFTDPQTFTSLATESRNFVFQPDMMNLGGISEARHICEIAESFGVPVAPHDAQGRISKAVCLQLAATHSTIFILEDFEEFNLPWTKDLANPVVKDKGFASIPNEPGLGVELNMDIVEAHGYDPRAFIALYEPGWEHRQPSKTPGD